MENRKDKEVNEVKKLNEKIINIRVELQNSNIKKSGKNKFAGFSYYELSDFLPKLNELMKVYKINDRFTIADNVAMMQLIDCESNEMAVFTMPFVNFDVPTNKNGIKQMQDIQYLGALNTYYKRYLYLNAFGITDGEVIDSLDNKDLCEQPQEQSGEFRNKLKEYIELNNLNQIDICKKYKLNANSLEEEFKNAYLSEVGGEQ